MSLCLFVLHPVLERFVRPAFQSGGANAAAMCTWDSGISIPFPGLEGRFLCCSGSPPEKEQLPLCLRLGLGGVARAIRLAGPYAFCRVFRDGIECVLGFVGEFVECLVRLF